MRGAWVLAALVATGCGGPSKLGIVSQDDAARALATCDGCAGERELRRAVKDDAQLEFVKRVNAQEFALTGRPLVGGNEARLLLDGPQTHSAQLAAIREAKHHVHLITYIMTDDSLAKDYLEALAERSRAGVKVRFMFDAMGSRTVSEAFRGKLEAAKIQIREFGPLDPLKKEKISISRRHHRKILVVDGRIAFTGGINISDEYREASSGTSAKTGGWRDTHVQIRGPGVKQFQDIFLESWALAGDPLPKDAALYPKLRDEGNAFVRGVTQNGNDVGQIALKPLEELTEDERKEAMAQAIYGSYLAAINNARSRIWITQAYFIPNQEFMDVLAKAARRGVDVRILVPSTSDIQMMVHASRFHYEPLLEAGARIFEYAGPMLHAKTMVVDGVWATVGSSNIDYRSFIHNDEANAIIIGHEFGAEMERMYLDDAGNAREITRKAWAQRSWSDRMRQRSAVLLKYWI